MATDTEIERARSFASIRKAVLAIAVAAAGLVIALNLADLAVRTCSPLLNSITASYSANAAVAEAEHYFVVGELKLADKKAKEALRNKPLAVRALRTLGLSLEAQERNRSAAEAMAVAGALGWRDTPTQLWLIAAYSRQQDFDAALDRVEALVRRGQHKKQMFGFLLAAATEREFKISLAKRLAQRSRWRQQFFEAWRQIPASRARVYVSVLKFLRAEGVGVSAQEVEPFITGLFEQRSYRIAHDVWKTFGSGGALINDGGFTYVDRASTRASFPFAWQFGSAAGLDVTVGNPPTRTGSRALYARLAGSAPVPVAEQALVLAPGKYLMFLNVLPEEGPFPQGITITFSCLPGDQLLQLSQRNAREAGLWTQFIYEITVPNAGCDAQAFSLILGSLERGTLAAWFDDLRISAVGE